jgi:hypothetical protein
MSTVQEVDGIVKSLEYKTVVLPFTGGVFKRGLPDIESALNKEGRDGWQLKETLLPSSSQGTSDYIVAILERRVE